MAASRRTFLKTAGSGIALAAAWGAVPARADDTVRHAVLGLGGQGRRHARTFAGLPSCQVVAVCDVDPARRAQSAGELPNPEAVAQVEDFRRILADPAIDSVSIASPDHWHAPMALMALQAGKHVYIEKPCCHNVHEGTMLERAAAATGLCVQHGTQSRSGEGIATAMAYLAEGHLGTIRAAKAINHQLRGPIGRKPVADPPPGVDYDLWLGPAPEHPFTENRWHYNWHWFWDYGTGDMGNDGIHQIDVARWGLGVGFPNAVSASGGQLFYDDDHETPDTQVVTFEYPGKYLIYEMRLWTDYALEGHDNGTVFYGDKGILEVGRNGCEVTLKGEAKRKIGEGSDFERNIRNFVECVQAGTPDKLNSPIGEGVISATLCHLGNIATRLGARLTFDAATRTCPGNDAANALLSRDYRKGYELPEVG